MTFTRQERGDLLRARTTLQLMVARKDNFALEIAISGIHEALSNACPHSSASWTIIPVTDGAGDGELWTHCCDCESSWRTPPRYQECYVGKWMGVARNRNALLEMTCPECQGRGYPLDDSEVVKGGAPRMDCPRCEGFGKVPRFTTEWT